jgi:hypothetical protein
LPKVVVVVAVKKKKKKSNIICRPVEVHRRFREKNCLHLQGRRVSEGISRRQPEKLCLKPACCKLSYLVGAFFDPENGGNTFLRIIGKLLPYSAML